VVDGFELWAFADELDEPADISWLGEFTNDDDEETVPNPRAERGSYSHFRPTYSLAERFADYRRTMPAAVARERAYSDAVRDAQMAVDLRPIFVTVTAERDGVEYGSASLGSDAVEWLHEYDADEVIADSYLADEAVANAWPALAAALHLDARLYEEVSA
jgi:hypothetical protein